MNWFKNDFSDFGAFSGSKNALRAHLRTFVGLMLMSVMLMAFASKFLSFKPYRQILENFNDPPFNDRP